MTTVWVIAAAVIVPLVLFGVGYEIGRVHAQYVRHRFLESLIDEGAYSDFVEREAQGVDRDSLWGECQRGGYHSIDMRLDRVRRHPEAPTTFPAGEPQ